MEKESDTKKPSLAQPKPPEQKPPSKLLKADGKPVDGKPTEPPPFVMKIPMGGPSFALVENGLFIMSLPLNRMKLGAVKAAVVESIF